VVERCCRIDVAWNVYDDYQRPAWRLTRVVGHNIEQTAIGRWCTEAMVMVLAEQWAQRLGADPFGVSGVGGG